VLVTTRGFRDLLHIGNQSRPRIFDLEIRTPDVLYERVVEVDEEVGAARALRCGALQTRSPGPEPAAAQVVLPLGRQPGGRAGRRPAEDAEAHPVAGRVVQGVTGEAVCVRRELDLGAVEASLQVRGRRRGAVAVTLLRYVRPKAAAAPGAARGRLQQRGSRAQARGHLPGQRGRRRPRGPGPGLHAGGRGTTAAAAPIPRAVLGGARCVHAQVSLSHEVMQMVKMVPRGFTATADAYLTPHIMRCARPPAQQGGRTPLGAQRCAATRTLLLAASD